MSLAALDHPPRGTDAADFDPADVHTSIPRRFARQVRLHGHRTAVRTAKYQWTYQQLDTISGRLAAEVLTNRPDSVGGEPAPIALLMDHDALMVGGILAVLKLGWPYVALDPSDAPGRRRAVYNATAPQLLIADAEHHNAAVELTGSADRVISAEAGLRDSPFRAVSADVAPDALANVFFTSGTTGQPKGVAWTHRAMLYHCRQYTLAAGLNCQDRIALTAPCHVGISGLSLWAALMNGAELDMFPLRSQGVAALARWVADNRLTLLHCVPSVFRALAAAIGPHHAGGPLETVRVLRIGGEAFYPRDFDLFRWHTRPDCRLLVVLSSCETLTVSMTVLNHDSPPPLPGERFPLGTPTEGTDLWLEDESGRTAAGQIGRIVVASRYLALGYWRQPELTVRHFHADPNDPTRRIFHSNDLGRIGIKGTLEFHGRSDAVIKLDGHRIDPGEIESAMIEVGPCKEAAVIARQDGADPARLVAYVTGTEPSAVNTAALRGRLASAFRHT